MNEIGLNINVDSYNNEGIKTIKGNNNAEIYKLYILKNKRRLSLVGKTVKLGYVMAGTTKGDIIENLNITNAEQGEITFPITNRISKQDGVYSCQLAIYGADEFLEYTATFGLTVEANIFTKIAGEIADSKDFTYLENILDKASKLSEKLKENTSSATNINSNLESNITEANNINSKLLENTSTATGLNKNLESNIDLAKEVKETIKDLDTKNIEATSKIERLEGLNAKAEELSNNINEALPVKDALVKNTEEAKAANTNLLAANQEATTKNTELQASLEKTKEFINGLDGSQNIPQLRLDVTELQNGLKSNQALAYTGSSISADNTLEGRTESLKIEGRTLQNLCKKIIPTVTSSGSLTNIQDIYKCTANGSGLAYLNFTLTDEVKSLLDGNKKYTIFMKGYKLINPNNDNIRFYNRSDAIGTNINKINDSVLTFTTPSDFNGSKTYEFLFYCGTQGSVELSNEIILLEGDWTGKKAPEYFEGIKSFGESEQEGDKYKISILSKGKNLLNPNLGNPSHSGVTVLKEGGCITLSGKSDVNAWSGIEIPMYLPKGEYYFKYKADGNGFIKANVYDKQTKESVSGDIDFPDGKIIRNTVNREVFIKLFLKGANASEELINKYWDIQLEEGSQATSYEPYKQDKKDILIKEPLRSLGNIQDILYEDNGQIKINRYVKEYTFTGDEVIGQWANSNDACWFTINSDSFAFNYNSSNDNLICNNFIGYAHGYFSSSNPIQEGLEGVTANSNYFTIRIKKTKLSSTDVAGFKAWLKANPTTIVYELDKPITEIVENCVDIDLDTFGEKTYFNILNSLPGSLDFKVPSNIASIVQNTAREVNNIWDVINNLLVPSLIDINKNVAMATIKNNLK
ncbi:BppU family phage baseplate upper protein [Clostridium perfringens]|nr:BppU family phage baseplate upper protein [Clostridium perfringens]